MLNNKNIICLASSNWDDLWVNAQHLMDRLSKNNRVLYVESTGLRSPSGSISDVRKIWVRIKSLFRGVRIIHETLYIVSPIILPFYQVKLIEWINNKILVIQLRYLIKRFSLDQPILWIFLPTGYITIGKLQEKLVVYHCVDDYSSNPGVVKSKIKKMESDVLKLADVVITTSPNLFCEKQKYNSNVHYLPNVADVTHFTKGSDRKCYDSILDKVTRPIIGYLGNISNYKVDFELLEYLAKNRPHWSVVLIGPIGVGDPGTDISALRSYPNIHFMGRQPYELLPLLIKKFDVGIVPFRVNEYTISSHPMKLNEYLAAGINVVSTNLPAFQEYRDVIYLSHGFESFLRNIEIALSEEVSLEKIKMRETILLTHSWDKRMEQISDIIQKATMNK